MPNFQFFVAVRPLLMYLRRHWYGSEYIGANRRGKPPVPLRFENTQALFQVADKAIAVERACGLGKLANISHWGDTGDVQLMYLDQVDELLRTTLDCANHPTPLTANDIAQRLAEGLLRIESRARSDAADTDGYATASVWRVRASLFAQRRPSTSWVRSIWRNLDAHN